MKVSFCLVIAVLEKTAERGEMALGWEKRGKQLTEIFQLGLFGEDSHVVFPDEEFC